MQVGRRVIKKNSEYLRIYFLNENMCGISFFKKIFRMRRRHYTQLSRIFDLLSLYFTLKECNTIFMAGISQEHTN